MAPETRPPLSDTWTHSVISRYLGWMIWIYGHDERRLLYEIRPENTGDGYQIVVKYPDGRVRVERAADSAELIRRSRELQQELQADGWTPLMPH